MNTECTAAVLEPTNIKGLQLNHCPDHRTITSTHMRGTRPGPTNVTERRSDQGAEGVTCGMS